MQAGIHRVALPTGESVSALGLGTWRMGEEAARRAEEIATVRQALDLGVTLIDTAEMYGQGRAEELVGEAVAGRRDEAFLVSKVVPSNASRAGTRKACEASLRRLRTDRLDLYLLHWPGSIPVEETVRGFEDLVAAGKIRSWGVSNFNTENMEELLSVEGGTAVVTNQVLYNLSHRGIEWDLLPELRKRRIPVMAYSPFHEGRLLKDRKLVNFAKERGRTEAEVALGWLLSMPDVIAIPKTSSPKRLRENLAAVARPLTEKELAELDEVFPPPEGPQALEMI